MKNIYEKLEREISRAFQLMYDQIDEFKLMIGNGIYLKDYLNEDNKLEYILCNSSSDGKIFRKGLESDECDALFSIGFKKVPVK